MINIDNLKIKYGDEECGSCGDTGRVRGFKAKETVRYDKEGEAQELEDQVLTKVLCECGGVLKKVN